MLNEQVVVYLLNPNNDSVFYLRKDHGPKIIVNKLVGLGGSIEQRDIVINDKFKTIINACERELSEELEKPLGVKYLRDDQSFIYQGRLWEGGRLIHILKTTLSCEPPSRIKINGEGILEKRSINYHKFNPNEFPTNDLNWLDKLYFTQKFFEIK